MVKIKYVWNKKKKGKILKLFFLKLIKTTSTKICMSRICNPLQKNKNS